MMDSKLPGDAVTKSAMTEQPITLRVHSITHEADEVYSFDLRPRNDELLPAFTAGAHILLTSPVSGNNYSLVNPQSERHRYLIAVKRDPAGRGGSKHLCDILRPGQTVEVLPPINLFPLAETASLSVFIAGGIGITPIWSMIQRCEAIGGAWRLYYAARAPSGALFRHDLKALELSQPGRVITAFGETRLKLAKIVESLPPDAHVYCCGPISMLEDFTEVTRDLPPEIVHLEYFASKSQPAAGGFYVELKRSGRRLFIPPDKSILQVISDLGIKVPSSCRQGRCGTCETRVLSGIPDHRDVVLSARQKEANKTMMICCSGAKTEELVLDI